MSTMEHVYTRPAEEADLPAVLEIYNDAILNSTATLDTEPQTLTEKREWLRETSYPYSVLVAVKDQQVVGWGSLRRFRAKAAYRFTAEDSVYVRKDWHGRGVGTQILNRLLGVARANGLHTVIAGIALPNDASEALHRRLGFQPIGIELEVGYKFERWIDVMWMQKLL